MYRKGRKRVIRYDAPPADEEYARPQTFAEADRAPRNVAEYADYLSALLDITETELGLGFYTEDDKAAAAAEKAVSIRRMEGARHTETTLRAVEWVTLFKLRLLMNYETAQKGVIPARYKGLAAAGAVVFREKNTAQLSVMELRTALICLNRAARRALPAEEAREYLRFLGYRAAAVASFVFARDDPAVDAPSLFDLDEKSARINANYLLEMNELFMGLEEMLCFVDGLIVDVPSPLAPPTAVMDSNECARAVLRMKRKAEVAAILGAANDVFGRLIYETRVSPNEPHAYRDTFPDDVFSATSITAVMRPAEFKEINACTRAGVVAALDHPDTQDAAFMALADAVMRIEGEMRGGFLEEVLVLWTALDHATVVRRTRSHPHPLIVVCFGAWLVCDRGAATRTPCAAAATAVWARRFLDSRSARSDVITRRHAEILLEAVTQDEKQKEAASGEFSAPSFIQKRKWA